MLDNVMRVDNSSLSKRMSQTARNFSNNMSQTARKRYFSNNIGTPELRNLIEQIIRDCNAKGHSQCDIPTAVIEAVYNEFAPTSEKKRDSDSEKKRDSDSEWRRDSDSEWKRDLDLFINAMIAEYLSNKLELFPNYVHKNNGNDAPDVTKKSQEMTSKIIAQTENYRHQGISNKAMVLQERQSTKNMNNEAAKTDLKAKL